MEPYQYQPRTELDTERTSELFVKQNENVGKGILGAALFSVGGAVVWIILYKIGIIASAAGLLTIYLAVKGYEKFSGVRSITRKGIAVCIVVTLLMLAVAMYISVGLILGSFADIPYYMGYGEVKAAVIGDYLKGVALMAIYAIAAFFSDGRSKKVKKDKKKDTAGFGMK